MSFGRIVTAMVTPMNEALEVDYTEAKHLAQYLVAHGSDGLVVSGTTGESPTLTDPEKIELFKAVKEALPNHPVIAGIGTNDTAASVDLAKEAAQTGVDALMAVVPYYNKPSQEGIYQHFKAVAEATALPLMLYNIAGRSVVNMLPDTVKRLAEIPNVVALKESPVSMDQVSELKRVLPPEFSIYSGDDSMTLPMLAVGCQGVVSVASHIIGDEMKDMVDSWFAGDITRAAQRHLELFPVFKGIFVTSSPVPIKTLLNLFGHKVGEARLPLFKATEAERQFLVSLMDEINKIRR